MRYDKIKALSVLDASVVRLPVKEYPDFLNTKFELANFDTTADRESFLLASKEFGNLLEASLKGDSIEPANRFFQTAYKYWSRMSYKTTPFGTFAGAGVTTWGKSGNDLSIEGSWKELRFDSDFSYFALRSLIESNAGLRQLLEYKPNSTMYRWENYFKFYFLKDQNDGDMKINRLGCTEELELILETCKNGATYGAIVSAFKELGAEPDEVQPYLDSLIDIGFIVDNFRDITVNLCPLDKFIGFFGSGSAHRSAIPELDNILRRVALLKTKLDSFRLKSLQTEDYNDLSDTLQELSGYTSDRKSHFHGDLHYVLNDQGLNRKLQGRLKKGIWALSKIGSWRIDPLCEKRLSYLKKEFKKRFANKIVPLSELFDLDKGLRYPHDPNISQGQATFHIAGALLQKHLVYALKSGSKTIRLTIEELSMIDQPQVKLPQMFSTIYSLLDASEGLIHLHSIFGNPIALINRFSGNQHVDAIVNELNGIRSQQQNSKICHILHVPKPKFFNIAKGSYLADFYVNYGTDAIPKNQQEQLNLNDICVAIVDDELMVISNDGCHIIPAFDNMISDAHFELPAMRFLHDFSLINGNSSLAFEWQNFSREKWGYDFLPRIEFEGVVLKPASWIVEAQSLLALETYDRFLEYVNSREIPKFCIMKSRGTESLLMDLHSDLGYKLLHKEISRCGVLTLEEFPEEMIKSGQKRTNEIFSFFYQSQPTGLTSEPYLKSYIKRLQELEASGIEQSFQPGDQWIYYKIYLDPEHANRFLIDTILPILSELAESDSVSKWFFIRYYDPEFHLRLRILETGSAPGSVIRCCNRLIAESLLVDKFVLDSYQRESLRYGPLVINQAEEIFQIDSNAYLRFLSKTLHESDRAMLDFKFSVISILKLFEDFKITDKARLLYELATAYQKEFYIEDANIFKFRQYKEAFKWAKVKCLGRSVENTQLEYWIESIVGDKSTKLRPVINNMYTLDKTSLEHSVKSHIHMTLNRIFMFNPRFQELVIYSILDLIYNEKKLPAKNK